MREMIVSNRHCGDKLLNLGIVSKKEFDIPAGGAAAD